MNYIILVGLFVATTIFQRSLTLTCLKQLSTCSCLLDYDGIVIDFSPLNNVTFPFQDQDDFTKETFLYNPCSPINCDGINLAAICMKSKNNQTQIVGYQSTATFISTNYDSTIMISYTDGNIVSDVTFVCLMSNLEIFLIVDSSNSSYYRFQVISPYACVSTYETTTNSITTTTTTTTTPTTPTTTPTTTPNPPSPGLSVGTIILLIAVIIIAIYLVVGAIIQIFYYKASGIRIIPNLLFWTVVASFIIDGWTYIFQFFSMKNSIQETKKPLIQRIGEFKG